MLGALFCCLVVAYPWGLWLSVGLVALPLLDITPPKKGMDVDLKWYFSLFNLRLTSLHLCSTLHTIALWSVPSSYPFTNISSAIPKTFGMSLNSLSILHWNISPTGAAPSGSHLYLYLPKWQANVVRYNDFSSNFRLWFPEPASIIDKYLTLLT